MKELKGIYESDFNEIKKYIEKEAAPGTERDDAIESLSEIYLEAQENGTELSDIRGESAKEYAKEIAESLPKKKRANKKKLGVILASFAVIAAAIFGCWNAYTYFTGDKYLLEQYGFNFVWNNPDKFVVERDYENALIDGAVYVVGENEAGSNGKLAQNGIKVDAIEVTEVGKTITVTWHIKKMTDEFGIDYMMTPAVPQKYETFIDGEFCELLYFSGYSELYINDSVFAGRAKEGSILENGELCFDMEYEIRKHDGTDIVEYVRGHKPIRIDEEFTILKWKYAGKEIIENLGYKIYGNALKAESIEFNIIHEDWVKNVGIEGIVEGVSIDVFVDYEKKEILDTFGGGLKNIQGEIFHGDFVIAEDRKSITVGWGYIDSNGERHEMKTVFNIDDFI